jgi:hypothetical protein
MRGTAVASPRPGQGEALVVWAVLAAALAAVVATYARFDARELYNVSGSGLEAGFGRGLVLLNFPIAVVAPALALVALDALPRRAWLAFPVVVVAAAAVPFAVDDDDLDARAVNVIPALGVVAALCLTVAATRRAGAGLAPRDPDDRVRLAALAVIGLVSLPWLFAELGWYIPGDVLLAEERIRDDGRVLAAVHIGHHHGLDGALIAASGVVLTRVRLGGRRIAVGLRACVALMLAYGVVNLAQDAWHEQVVKRDWANWGIPSAAYPSISGVWAVIVVLWGAAYVLLGRRARPRVEQLPARSVA